MKSLILLSIALLSSVAFAQEVERPTKYYEIADYQKIASLKQNMTVMQVRAILKGRGEVDFPYIGLKVKEAGMNPMGSEIFRQYVTFDQYGWTFSPANPADPMSPRIAAILNDYHAIGRFTLCFEGTMQEISLGTAKLKLEENSRRAIEIFGRRYHILHPETQRTFGQMFKGRKFTGGVR